LDSRGNHQAEHQHDYGERYRGINGEPVASLLACRLETGRTHQIRVHLSEVSKTPLLADSLYGRAPNAADLAEITSTLGRQALHAAVLGFSHPITEEALRFEAPLPADFAQALSALQELR